MRTRLRRLERWMSRKAARPALRFACFAALALAATAPYLVSAGEQNVFRDAEVLWSYEDNARRTVLEHGQVPLWNPWYCGGLPALGSPQTRFASPTFLFTLLFGTTRGEALTLFAMVLLALEGAYRYLRERRATRLAALLAAPVFGLSGILGVAPFLGWLNFTGFALLPWALLGGRWAAKGSLRGAVLVAVAFAFIVGFGGTYVAPITAVACLVEGLVVLGERRGRRGRRVPLAWGMVFAAIALAVGLSAARLWTIADELARTPRVVAGLAAPSPLDLITWTFGFTPR